MEFLGIARTMVYITILGSSIVCLIRDYNRDTYVTKNKELHH
jgi:hypothetical protein